VNNVFIPKYFDSNIKKFFNDYLPYLKDGGIDEYEDDEEYAPSGCVSFLTIHQSKGLEDPVVIVGSLWDKPNDRPDEIKEYIDENILREGMHIHFIGIGGKGQNGIASICYRLGFMVSGSDDKTSQEITHLISLGINVSVGHDLSVISGSDLIVYSSVIKDEHQSLTHCSPYVNQKEDLLFCGSNDGIIRIYNPKNGKILKNNE
jgi:hypothetical protein